MEETSFGELLREGRERRGLTVEALARTTRVPEATLRALESGGLDGLPPEVYTKGFIRSISRAVGIPEAGPLERYIQAIARQRQAAAANSAAEALAKPDRRSRQQVALVVGAVVVLMILLVLVLRSSS